MMNASDEHADLSRNDLIQELLRTIRSAHADVIRRISAGPDESMMAQLLELNDVIIGGIQLYDGLVAGTMKRETMELEEDPVDEEAEEDEDDDDEEEGKDVEDIFDLLNLDGSAEPEKKTKQSKKKSKKKNREEEPVFIPKLAPPPSSKKLARKSSGPSTPTNTSADTFDLFGFDSAPASNAQQTPTNSSNSFDLFSTPAPTTSNPVQSQITPVTSDKEEEDDDDFFALAMRQTSEQSVAPATPQQSNPFDF